MAGPWAFSTLVGLLVMVQLCNARHLVRPQVDIASIPKENATLIYLQKIMGNVRRISDMLAFQILDQEEQRATLEEKRASKNPKRKCVLQSLILGKPLGACAETTDENRKVKSSRRSLSQKKRRLSNNAALNSNSNKNINEKVKNKEDSFLKSETPLKRKSPNRWVKNILNKSGSNKRLRSDEAPPVENANLNKNVNINLNDNVDGPEDLNNEVDGLGALSDDDNGPGALNDETDEADTLNDEVDGPGALSDNTDDLDPTGIFKDEDDEPNALNDEDDGFATLNDEDGPGALNDEEQLNDEFEK